MTLPELEKIYAMQIELGFDKLPLLFKFKRDPKRKIRSSRIRTPFGLCQAHRYSESEVAIYVTMDQLRKYLLKAAK